MDPAIVIKVEDTGDRPWETTETPDWQNINVKEEIDESHVDDIATSSQILPPVVPDIIYACIVCGSMFPQVPQVLEHIMKSHRGGVLCLKCKYLMPSNLQLKEHEKNCHTERPFFIEYIKCSICCTLFQYSESNAVEVCNNCVAHCKQDISLIPSVTSNNITLQDNPNNTEMLDLQTANLNSEFIDINTFIMKTENVDETNVSESNTENISQSSTTAMLETKENTNKEISPSIDIPVIRNEIVPNTTLKLASNIHIHNCEKKSNTEALTNKLCLAYSKFKKSCKNDECFCVSFAKEKLDFSACKSLCDIQNKLSRMTEEGLSRNVEYFVHCLICQKDLLLKVYFTSHAVQYHRSKCCVCSLCGRNISSFTIPQFLKHFDNHLDAKIKQKTKDCIICNASFLSDYNSYKHSKFYHSPPFPHERSSVIETPLSESDLEKLSAMKKICYKQYFMEKYAIHCNSCGEDFTRIDYFENHILECTKYNMYACSFCFGHYLVERSTFIMQTWVHCLMTDFASQSTCVTCHLSFPTLDNLNMHKINKHETKGETGSQSFHVAINKETLDLRNLDIAYQKKMLSSCNIEEKRNETQINQCIHINDKPSDLTLVESTSVDNINSRTLGTVNCVQTPHNKKEEIRKPKKIGREELQEAVITKNMIRQVRFILKCIAHTNRNYPNKEYYVFCLACRNEILFKDFITKHFIPCYEAHGGKCSFCGLETEEERNNVLDHLLHVWNSHIACKSQYKMHLCTNCNILLPSSYNVTLHKAIKHSFKN